MTPEERFRKHRWLSVRRFSSTGARRIGRSQLSSHSRRECKGFELEFAPELSFDSPRCEVAP
jgi:hypothetical protein